MSRQYVSINHQGMISSNDVDFFKEYINQQMPIAIRAHTWFDALHEMFPELSLSELTRRIKSGAYKAGPEAFDLEEANQLIGLKPVGKKGFDCQIVAFGKQRGVIVCSEELRGEL